MARDPAVPKHKKGHRPSSTGVRNPPVEMANWRRQVQASRVKFDDNQKTIFVETLRRHGRKCDAARAASVSLETVRRHMDDDPDFLEACTNAIAEANHRIIEHARRLTMEGTEEPIIGGQFKDEVVATKRTYPIQLIAMELRRIDPAYRDKDPVDDSLARKSGVMIAPAEVGSAMEWAARFGQQKVERPGDEAT